MSMSKNLISDININNGFVQTKKTTSDKLQKALVKSFGMLPILYDLNLQQITDIEELTTNINVDKIKDILSAA